MKNLLGSSNGRTAAFGAVSGGSNPPLRTCKNYNLMQIRMNILSLSLHKILKI